MDPTPTVTEGPLIPFVPGHTEVPQGLGYDEEHDELVFTFYDCADARVGVIVFADAGGGTTARVTLRGLDHYGGVTLTGGRTYVSGRGRVQVHDTQALRRGVAEPLATVGVRASSTVTSFRGSLWVSSFHVSEPGSMWRYDLLDGRPVDTGERLSVPPRTQGVSFDEGGHAWFSRSWGRANGSTLTRVSAPDLATDGGWTADNGRDHCLPPLAEGSVVVDERLHQLYESGAAGYRRHVRPHHVRRLFLGPLDPRERLSVHDLSEGARGG
ncbi:hypothetical protein [Janibacter sp. GS2]|uniref:hypothetical protein n=1 Tax=Janibacter sp. GS2 TaxID=3442646 RepID=UPI003EC0C1B1